ncbi:MAG: sensor histidine kinase [Alphaproteobacteria bacterium]|nr:sensor histidine kinase [Alphaproteobacteria bacterium]
MDNAKRHGRPPIEVSVAAEGVNANLTVTDHGSGIPGADREHVFEPFFRKASATSNSTGLGLALVRQIARHHGGDVSVEGNNTLLVRLPKSGI